MMGPRPWQPARELDGALHRGNLRQAHALAEELRCETGRPIDLPTALRFLPLIAERSPGEYSSYALRWLARWLTETPATSIETAAQVASALAALPGDPDAVDGLLAAR